MELITVIVTRYAESDEIVLSCLESLKRQLFPVGVHFLDQQRSDKVIEFVNSDHGSRVNIVYEQIPAKSLSYARNYGLSSAKSRYVAFCDVDCVLDNQWAKAIIDAFQSTNATIIGTKIVPVWELAPSWYMDTKYVRDFFSLLDLGNGIIPVPKVIGASFAIDKSRISAELSFDENLGRQNGRLLGGEETDLCARVRKSGGEIYYTSLAIANHQIQKERISFKWLQKRVFYGGISRAIRGGRAEPFSIQTSLFDKIGIIPFMPAYIAGRVYGLCLRNSSE